MQLKSLKIFCDTVSLRSFSKAADENGVSQSNASQVVHHLEQRLGVELIDRSTRPFRVTPAGQAYFDGCRSIVHQYDELERAVQAVHAEAAARLSIGAIYSVGLAHMSQYLEEFKASYPKAEVQVGYWHPDRVYEAVETGQVDLGIVSFPARSRHLACEPWRDEPMVVVCPPGHELAGHEAFAPGGRAPLSILDGQQLVAFDRELVIREKLDRVLGKQKIEVTVAHAFDNIETIKRAVESGAGVSLLPAPTVASELESGALVAAPLEDASVVRPLGVLHRRDRDLGALAKSFIGLLQSHADDACLEPSTVQDSPTAGVTSA